MNNTLCRNCNREVVNGKCPNCGYNMDLKEADDNAISNKELKERFGDMVLSWLANNNLISMEKDTKHLVIEFGYLLMPKNYNDIKYAKTIMKVTTGKRLFRPSKVFYIAYQKESFMLLNENFTEKEFRKISNDMLFMHKVDLDNIDRKEYYMELY